MTGKQIPIIPFYHKLNKFEISCVLFDKCNLKCPFCFEQNKKYKIDNDYIDSIGPIIFDKFATTIKDQHLTIDHVNIMLWGGELFFDGVSDETFEHYSKLIDSINSYFAINYPSIKVTYRWLSNGVFTKRARVIALLSKYKDQNSIAFSYDPVDRFATDHQRQLMIDNAIEFNRLGLGRSISITLTKPNIEHWLNDISDLIYFRDHQFEIDVNFYIANNQFAKYQPTDQLIYQWLKIAVDNQLFNVNVIERVLSKNYPTVIDKFCDCHQCSQITEGVWTTNCVDRSTNLPYDRFYGKYSQYINEANSNQVKASIGLLKRGCLACRHHDRCQMCCWVSILFDQYQCTECPYCKLYDYVETNQSIIDQFEAYLAIHRPNIPLPNKV